MEIFAASKGCVYVPNPQNGAGSYAIEGLGRGSSDSPILILGSNLQDADIVLPVSTIDGEKIFYTFGRGWGDVAVLGTVLLGNSNNVNNGLKTVTQWFESKRATSNPDSAPMVNLSTPGGPYKLFVHALGLGQPDPAFNIQPFMVYGKIASPKK